MALKRARLYPSYAVLWSGIGLLLVLLPAYADLLRWLSYRAFGIVGANHLIYAMLFSFLMIYLFYLTQKVCQLVNRVERLIVHVAILEAKYTASDFTENSQVSVQKSIDNSSELQNA
jgi:energy-coupling factor transporter transmembrane protein EcfT